MLLLLIFTIHLILSSSNIIIFTLFLWSSYISLILFYLPEKQ